MRRPASLNSSTWNGASCFWAAVLLGIWAWMVLFLWVPWWAYPVFAGLGLAALAAYVYASWRATERIDRLREGCCPACGYDLRASPDRCPECGAGIPVPLTRDMRRPSEADSES